EHHCQEIQFEKDHAARNKLWEARHNLAYAYIHGYPGKEMMVTDVSVPISELANAVLYARKLLDEIGLPGGILGHVGDGSFHTLIMIHMNQQRAVDHASQMQQQRGMHALKCGATSRGDHGVGVGNDKYQQTEHGTAYDVMEKIKLPLDPKNILKKGKLVNVSQKGKGQ